MSEDGDQSPRVYGQADETDKQGGTSNGMRGERASDPDPQGGFSRPATLSTGTRVEVKEESGTAHAEAQGADETGRS